jgi:hypothetical protein
VELREIGTRMAVKKYIKVGKRGGVGPVLVDLADDLRGFTPAHSPTNTSLNETFEIPVKDCSRITNFIICS